MPTPSAPPAEAVGRFQRDLERLTGSGTAFRLGIAVSGGPDSLALLRLAHAAMPGHIRAATVDHGLRPEAAREAADVARHCAALGIAHAVLGPEPLPAGNVQEQARKLRYRLLGRWAEAQGLAFVAVAHHRDDVAESFLMRALRGSGSSGLARMPAIAPLPYGAGTAQLVRPLLDWSRAELAAIAPDGADDPSNRDLHYDRARIRALIAATPALASEPLARAATNLAEAEAALDWLAGQAWRSRATEGPDGAIVLDAAGLPRDTRRRLAARAIRRLAPDWSGEGLDRLVDALDEGKMGTLGGVKARNHGLAWHFGIAPPRSGHH